MIGNYAAEWLFDLDLFGNAFVIGDCATERLMRYTVAKLLLMLSFYETNGKNACRKSKLIKQNYNFTGQTVTAYIVCSMIPFSGCIIYQFCYVMVIRLTYIFCQNLCKFIPKNFRHEINYKYAIMKMLCAKIRQNF